MISLRSSGRMAGRRWLRSPELVVGLTLSHCWAAYGVVCKTHRQQKRVPSAMINR